MSMSGCVVLAAALMRVEAEKKDLLETCKWVLGCLKNMPKNDDVVSAIRELELSITKAQKTH